MIETNEDTDREPTTNVAAKVPVDVEAERLESFGRAMEAIRREAEASVGEEDVAYMEAVRAWSRRFEILGRGLLYVSFDPLTYGVGLVSLFAHKQLETIEIGHTVLHGAYDRLDVDDALRSDHFEWKFCVDETSWRKEHNLRHHQHTNVVGKDPDLRFGPVRLSPRVPFQLRHRLQPLSAFATWPFFDLAIHLHATGILDAYFHGQPEPEVLRDFEPETLREARRVAWRKMAAYYGREFVLFPALAGPFFPKVLVGNALTELARNVYTAATIYCGHVDTDDHPAGTRAKNRAEWYRMQVEAANDFDVPLPLSILCGGLDYQIEHHLFPRLPPNRLREIAPRVREACEAHGVKYRRESWPRTLGRVLGRLRELSRPVPAQG